MTYADAQFRQAMGVSKMQYTALQEMKDRGEVRRGQIVVKLHSMHGLRDRGFLEYVPSASGNHDDDLWRLTDHGRELIRSWGLQPNAETVTAFNDPGQVYEGATEDIFEEILSEPDAYPES